MVVDQYDGIGTFYGMPKVYKNKIPISLQPIISAVNILIHTPEKLVGKWLSPITKKVLTCIIDLDYLIKKLSDLGSIQTIEFLFIANTVPMYPNIDTEEGITAILLSFELNVLEYNVNLPLKVLLRALQLMMKYNIFRFEDIYYRQ